MKGIFESITNISKGSYLTLRPINSDVEERGYILDYNKNYLKLKNWWNFKKKNWFDSSSIRSIERVSKVGKVIGTGREETFWFGSVGTLIGTGHYIKISFLNGSAN